MSACVVQGGVPATAASGVTLCPSTVIISPLTITHTHRSLLTAAGALESWCTQALAGMHPDILPSWRPVSDNPATPEAQLRDRVTGLRCWFFSKESAFFTAVPVKDLDSSQPECYQILVYWVFIVCVQKRKFVFFKPQLSLAIEDVSTQKGDYPALIKMAGGTPARTAVTYQKSVSTCVFVCVLLLAIVISW